MYFPRNVVCDFSRGDIHAHSNTHGAPDVEHWLGTFLLDLDVPLPAIHVTPIFPTQALPSFPALFTSAPFHPPSLFLPFLNIHHPLLATSFWSPAPLMANALPTLNLPRKTVSFLKYSLCWLLFSQTLEFWSSISVLEIVHISSQFYVQASQGWQLRISPGGGSTIFTPWKLASATNQSFLLPPTPACLWRAPSTGDDIQVVLDKFLLNGFSQTKDISFLVSSTEDMFLCLLVFWRVKYLSIVSKRTW